MVNKKLTSFTFTLKPEFVREIGMKSRRGFREKPLLAVLQEAKRHLEEIEEGLKRQMESKLARDEVSLKYETIENTINGVSRGIAKLTMVLALIGDKSKEEIANFIVAVPPFKAGNFSKRLHRVVQMFDVIAEALNSKDPDLATEVVGVTDEFAQWQAIRSVHSD